MSLDPNLLHAGEVGASWLPRRLGVSLQSNADLLEGGLRSEAVGYAEAAVIKTVSCGLQADSVLSEHKKEHHLLLQPPSQALPMKFSVGYDLDIYRLAVLVLAKRLEQ